MIARPINRRVVAFSTTLLLMALLACACAFHPPASLAAAILPDSATSFTADSNAPPPKRWVSTFAPEHSMRHFYNSPTPEEVRAYVQGDKNKNLILDRYEGGRFRRFTRTPPWVKPTRSRPFRGGELFRMALVFQNPDALGKYLDVAVAERDSVTQWTAEVLGSRGTALGLTSSYWQFKRIAHRSFSIPRTLAGSTIVVRLALPPHDTLYTTVRIQ